MVEKQQKSAALSLLHLEFEPTKWTNHPETALAFPNMRRSRALVQAFLV